MMGRKIKDSGAIWAYKSCVLLFLSSKLFCANRVLVDVLLVRFCVLVGIMVANLQQVVGGCNVKVVSVDAVVLILSKLLF